jgi:hypothetical protein
VSTFQIGKYEVTWGEWKTIRTWAVANGYSDLANVGEGSADNHPVRNVSWYDVVKWSNAKSQMEGLAPVYMLNGTIFKTGESVPTSKSAANGFRLPAEAEWEWAARGGVSSQGYTYSGSNDVNTVVWHANNSGGVTKSVGTKASNELGIYDMSGNVWEWCDVVTQDSEPCILGGSIEYNADHAAIVNRLNTQPGRGRYGDRGLRLARNIGPKISINGTMPEATLNQSYAGYTFTAVGATGAPVWSVSSGSLPPGMSFSANGTLSGTPPTAGTYTFVIRLESGGYWDEVEVELLVKAKIPDSNYIGADVASDNAHSWGLDNNSIIQIDGGTFRGGNATGQNAHSYGIINSGFIEINGGKFEGAIASGNNPHSYGILNHFGRLKIMGGFFSGGSGRGAYGIFNNFGELFIDGGQFEGGSGQFQYGIFNNFGELFIDGGQFEGGSGQFQYGIYNNGGNATISGGIIKNIVNNNAGEIILNGGQIGSIDENNGKIFIVASNIILSNGLQLGTDGTSLIGSGTISGTWLNSPEIWTIQVNSYQTEYSENKIMVAEDILLLN